MTASPPTSATRPRGAHRGDLVVVLAAVALFAVAAVVGHTMQNRDGSIILRWPPLYGYWDPHLGPGTLAALTVAGLVLGYGPGLAHRLGWRTLVLASWIAAMAWTWSLALVDGWERGVVGRLQTRNEYLRSVDAVDGLVSFLRDFAHHIDANAPDNWPAHVAGHPPGALLTFVALDRVGLAGGAWASTFCITVGTSAVAAALLATRALGGERLARRSAPFLVLAPAAVWYGVSADAYFAAVAAWGVALLALAATGATRSPRLVSLGAGLLFGLLCYLSYGLLLMAAVAGAVLLGTRTLRPLPWVLLGVAGWVVAFTAAGFWWYEGYSELVHRYYQGAAGVRPYGYFVWANLASNVVVVGLATVAALRRAALRAPEAFRRLRHGPVAGTPHGLPLLLAGAVTAVVCADLSGMSKAETERIWLPFTLWLLPATALLPDRGRNWWLGAQAAVALTVNHLLFTGW